jgi:hypothetical protein
MKSQTSLKVAPMISKRKRGDGPNNSAFTYIPNIDITINETEPPLSPVGTDVRLYKR